MKFELTSGRRGTVARGWTSAPLLALSLASFATGCWDQPEPSPSPEPSTAPTATTAPTPSPTPFSEVGVITPTPTPTPVPNPLTTLKVWPEEATADLNTPVQYHIKGTLRDGSAATLGELEWLSSDPTVATIDASGKVTPVAPGTTQLSASSEGVSSNVAVLEVLPNGQLFIRAVNAKTQAPIPGAQIYLGQDGTLVFTADENGLVEVAGDFSGPQTVTLVASGYANTTLMDVSSRRFAVPARPIADFARGKFSGSVDFSGMGALGGKNIRVGLITRSFYDSPLALDTTTLIGDYRLVEICGTATYLPSNIVGELPAGCPPDPDLSLYSVPGPTGTYDAYMLAGDLVASDVLTWLTDTTIFTNLGKLLYTIGNMYEFSYDVGNDIVVNAPNNTTDIPLAPDGTTSSNLTIKVPKMPSGIDPQYLPVVFALMDNGLEEGFLPVGVAGAREATTVPVYHAPEFQSDDRVGLVMAAETGVGSVGAYVVVQGRPEPGSDLVEPPPFMELLQLNKLEIDLATKYFAYYPVPDTTVHRAIFQWRWQVNKVWTYAYWDLYLPPEDIHFTLPEVPGALPLAGFSDAYSKGEIDLEVLAYDNADLDYQTFTQEEGRTIYDSSLDLYRISRNIIIDLADSL